MGCGCSKADGSELNDAGDENSKINHNVSALSSSVNEAGGVAGGDEEANVNVKRSPSKLQKRNRPKTPRWSDVGAGGNNINHNSIDEKRSLEHEANAAGLGLGTSGAVGDGQAKGLGERDGVDEVEAVDGSGAIATGTGMETGIENKPPPTRTMLEESREAPFSTLSGPGHTAGHDERGVATTPPPPPPVASTDTTTQHPSTPAAAILSDSNTTPTTASHRPLTPSTPTPRPQPPPTTAQPEAMTPPGPSHLQGDETPTLTPKASTYVLHADPMSTPTPAPGAVAAATAAATTTAAANEPWSSNMAPPPLPSTTTTTIPATATAGAAVGESSRGGLISAHTATTHSNSNYSYDYNYNPSDAAAGTGTGTIPGAFPMAGGLIVPDRRPSDQRSMSSESLYYSVRSFVE